MAKGHEKYQQEQAGWLHLGKDLARRSKSTCELSGVSGVSLRTYVIPPAKEADLDWCLMVSDEVMTQLSKPKFFQANEWRHLSELIWSDVFPVQVMCARILHHLSAEHGWAKEILEMAQLEEDTEAAAAAAPLFP